MFGWLKKLRGGARETEAPPALQGTLAEEDLQLALERPCAPLVFQKPATIDPFATLFGTVRLARKAQAWPALDGIPLWPLCQINLTQAPLVPDALRDLALITVFVSGAHPVAPTRIINTKDPDPAATWALRSYTALDGLTIPNHPAHYSPLSPCLGEWEPITPDFANHDMAGHVVDTGANDVCAFDWSHSVAQTKLGGWPATVQSAPWWDDRRAGGTWDFVMQIENEPAAKWQGWGDGTAYIARSRAQPHLWAMDVQVT